MPIQDFPIVNRGVNPGITFSSFFGELEAAKSAGLDLVKWMRGEYTTEEKTVIIAWYRGSLLIQEHSHDAAQQAAKRKN